MVDEEIAPLCACGCGKPTKRVTATHANRGVKKGDYAKYCQWHNSNTGKKKPFVYAIEDRGYLTPCWIFVGLVDKRTGYGVKHGQYAHRYSYVLAKGSVPDGLELDHLCRVRICVNPDHLDPVTHGENIRRSPIMGRPNRLSPAEKDAIRASGEKQRILAVQFGISQARVSQIRKGM